MRRRLLLKLVLFRQPCCIDPRRDPAASLVSAFLNYAEYGDVYGTIFFNASLTSSRMYVQPEKKWFQGSAVDTLALPHQPRTIYEVHKISNTQHAARAVSVLSWHMYSMGLPLFHFQVKQ